MPVQVNFHPKFLSFKEYIFHTHGTSVVGLSQFRLEYFTIFNRSDSFVIEIYLDRVIRLHTLTKEKVWELYGKGWAISGPYVEMVWEGWVMI